MTILLPSRKKKIVGLDFLNNKVIGVVASHVSNRVQPLQVFEMDCTFDDVTDFQFSPGILEQLLDLVKRFKLRGKQVVLSVPDHQIIVRYLDMPSVPIGALRQAVQVELGATIHLPFEDPAFDVVLIPPINASDDCGTGGCCLIAAPRLVIANMTNLAKQAGLIPTAVDIKPLAILRANGIVPRNREELTLVAHVSEEEVSLSIFIGSYLYFFRNMDMGIPNDVSDASQIQSLVTDIVYEMNRVISFFNFNLAAIERPLGCMYLYATHPYRTAICTEMEQQMSIPIFVIQQSELLVETGHQDLEAMVALGLAMKRGQVK